MSDILYKLIEGLWLVDADGKIHNATNEVVVNEDLILIKTKFIDDMHQIMEQMMFKIIGLKEIKLSGIIVKNDKETTLYFESI